MRKDSFHWTRIAGTALVIVTSLYFVSACGQQLRDNTGKGSGEFKFTNHLVHESSPYLLQHSHNPVNWYPWGQEALDRAKDEQKLIIISIGYSACHWCHVMEKESYEDTVVARIMNDHFISIKIDREERPDIDQVYIEAAQMLNNGRAGWPLNVIALPDATPVFAGTYFKKDQWIQLLSQIQKIYQNNPDKLHKQAGSILEGLQELNRAVVHSEEIISERKIKTAMNSWKIMMDQKNGGLQSNQKFPIPGGLEQLMTYGYLNKDSGILDLVELTLDNIALGGIYDHLGGGFHRYTVEPTWKIPHFEKMLYDNAQLVSLYSKAYQVFDKQLYRDRVESTLQFIVDDMTSEEGAFFSSYDADSEGEEGRFYVWTMEELQQVLGEETGNFLEYYPVTEKGNWEGGRNILFLTKDPFVSFENTAQQDLFKKNTKRLFQYREKRVKPALDDKILTSWNALMIKGFVDAYTVFGKEKYLKSAIRAADFIVENQMSEDGRLNRNYKDGVSAINGFLDDYAFTIRAFLELYQATFNEKWLNLALKLQEYSMTHFFDQNRGLFRYKSNLDEGLIVNKYETGDNVIPSGNSAMANNLSVLGNIYYDSQGHFLELSANMAKAVTEQFVRSPYYYFGWLPVFEFKNSGWYEIAIVGPGYQNLLQSLRKHFIPGAIFLGGAEDDTLPLLENKLVEGKTIIYVCRNKYCKLPVQNVEEAILQIERPENSKN